MRVRSPAMPFETVTGYCWPQSVAPGQPVGLHLSSAGGRPVQVEVARIGGARDVRWRETVPADFHPTPDGADANGCGWPVAARPVAFGGLIGGLFAAAKDVVEVAVLAAVVQVPGVSQFFGCTPLGPVAWAGVLTAVTAGAGPSSYAISITSGASETATLSGNSFPEDLGEYLAFEQVIGRRKAGEACAPRCDPDVRPSGMAGTRRPGRSEPAWCRASDPPRGPGGHRRPG